MKNKPRKKQDKKCLTKKITLRLLPKEILRLKEIGEGNLTEGVRRLLKL